MVSFDKDKLVEQIESLKRLPQIKEVKALRQRLEKELAKFESKEIPKEIPSIEEGIKKANLARSGKLKRYHHYIRLIHDNFPNLKYSEIRKQLSHRKQGKQVSIPDAVWENPSA